MIICELARIRTEEYKMDLTEFSYFLRVNYNTCRGWERGTSSPPLEIALEIAEKLNRRVEDVWHK